MTQTGWTFLGDQGVFQLKQPEKNSYLYFPLVNEAGMMSSVTPNLHGEVTSSHNTFLTAPVSVEDLHNSRASRNFWVYVEGHGAWSVTGNSSRQKAALFTEAEEKSELEAGFLWHKLTRSHSDVGLVAEMTSFVPCTDDKIELLKVKLTNNGQEELTITPTAAIPIYGRSADDLRDHRHVTSLLHRIYPSKYGVEVQPTLSFDERGHRINHVTYSVIGSEGTAAAPIGLFPITEEFIGEGGSLDWPQAIVNNEQPPVLEGKNLEGYEAIGALRFATTTLLPGQSQSYLVALVISEDRLDLGHYVETYLAEQKFDSLLEENQSYWKQKLDTLSFESGNRNYDLWMKWVTLQPVLRRLYGNSFLPYHDYGRGGRGWRDLWQDCLALMVMEPTDVRHLLLNNYAGVRIDGTNATIIGSQPGEFVADRNNIPRVWMDHGAWPLLTTLLYLNQSGDLEFLFQDQTYFRDSFLKRCKERDESWTPEQGGKLATSDGKVYEGTILEHILLQNVVAFFHVGEHNNIKLEGADWNDGLDLAPHRGESVAFTAFYASNLREIAELLREVKEKTGRTHIEVAQEIALLFDSLSNSQIDYESVQDKLNLLETYYDQVAMNVSGNKVQLEIDRVIRDLENKSDWSFEHLRKNEWIGSAEGYNWFNGYYNDDAQRVEGDHENGVRMTLTGQVFAIMGGIATDDQVNSISAAVNRYLKDDRIGYRLNSRFGEIQQNMGRAFGFAFGHKENGAMFSHMTVMYANALYKRGFVREGHDVLSSIYQLSTNFEQARIYPGVPEYINEKGRGMYTYLTGSASWLLLTELCEVFGIKGRLGDLVVEPKLLKEQFDEKNEAAVSTLFADRKLQVVYHNPMNLDYEAYQVASVQVDGQEVAYSKVGRGARIERAIITGLSEDSHHVITVTLK